MSGYVDIVSVSRYADKVITAGRDYNARSLPRLAAAVRHLRLSRGLTQAQLATRAGVSRQWVSALENGRTEGVELARLMQVLDALDASLVVRDDLEPGRASE
ncbi:MAG: helix-turn-helix transcriptional regulator [Actinomycetales bacterium]|nr:helix-turn-helix transcriptional regulator [Actinomycetales bacterium]